MVVLVTNLRFIGSVGYNLRATNLSVIMSIEEKLWDIARGDRRTLIETAPKVREALYLLSSDDAVCGHGRNFLLQSF